MRLRAGAATDIGRMREVNEDAYLSRPETGLFVVCDGMGGAAAGEVASTTAVRVIGEHADAPATGEADRFMPVTRQLAESVRQANTAIIALARADAGKAGMGTTVVAVRIEGDIASVAHVGDSRAYIWQRGRIEALTADHSLVEEQVRAGLIDRAESLQSVHQNILLRALGRDPGIEVTLTEVPLKSGDVLLLCSDGLTRMVSEDDMAAVIGELRDPQAICDRLVAMANDAGGPDNVTAVVVEATTTWGQFWNRLTGPRK